jgi:hypothetical protein
MEIRQFQDDRSSQLDSFEKGYNFLKTEYSTALLAAIKETNPAEQQKLISRVLEINTELTNQANEMIGKINGGNQEFDPTTLEDLTDDLVRYQEQYQQLKINKDKIETL